jgi:hypothetical protein
LPNRLVDDGYDGVIRQASLSWTVVVHDVAETQRALLHSILPTEVHFRNSHRIKAPLQIS